MKRSRSSCSNVLWHSIWSSRVSANSKTESSRSMRKSSRGSSVGKWRTIGGSARPKYADSAVARLSASSLNSTSRACWVTCASAIAMASRGPGAHALDERAGHLDAKAGAAALRIAVRVVGSHAHGAHVHGLWDGGNCLQQLLARRVVRRRRQTSWNFLGTGHVHVEVHVPARHLRCARRQQVHNLLRHPTLLHG